MNLLGIVLKVLEHDLFRLHQPGRYGQGGKHSHHEGHLFVQPLGDALQSVEVLAEASPVRVQEFQHPPVRR